MLNCIQNIAKLSTPPFATLDPFLFCVYHKDAYPAGNGRMEAPRKGNGADFDHNAPYRMYVCVSRAASLWAMICVIMPTPLSIIHIHPNQDNTPHSHSSSPYSTPILYLHSIPTNPHTLIPPP